MPPPGPRQVHEMSEAPGPHDLSCAQLSNRISYTEVHGAITGAMAPPLVKLPIGVVGHLLAWEKERAWRRLVGLGVAGAEAVGGTCLR